MKKMVWLTCAIWAAVLVLVVAFALKNSKSANIVNSYNTYENSFNNYTLVEPDAKQSILDRSIKVVKNIYSEHIAYEVIEASEKYDVPVYIIYALIFTESGGRGFTGFVNKNAMSSAACRGLTQISKTALAEYNDRHEVEYNWDQMYDIGPNIDVGVWFFAERFKGHYSNWDEAYIIYNAGYGNAAGGRNKYTTTESLQHCYLTVNGSAVDRFKYFEYLMEQEFADFLEAA